MRTWIAALVMIVSACVAGSQTSGGTVTSTLETGADDSMVARLLFAGDVMVGRRVAPVLEAEGPELFESARFVISSADLAAANLESPLSGRPHLSDNPNALEAPPKAARLLAGAGFDVMALANNHSGDAGPDGVLDTIDALTDAGLAPVGAGADISEAEEPVEIEVNGLLVSYLAFDVTGVGLAATSEQPGVVTYSAQTARRTVSQAARTSDLVVVALHGGVEYLSEVDPILEEVSGDLVGWGADVVWGQGSHVGQPVSIAQTGRGRNAVIATSLGNFLFDQQRDITQTGLILEVLASQDGVEAYRIGEVRSSDLRVGFTGWQLPSESAVLLDNEWWSLMTDPDTESRRAVGVGDFQLGDVISADVGDATGDGQADLVVSYRHPFRSNEVNVLFPDRDFADDRGRSAHLGVFDPITMEPRWADGTLLRPVAEIAVCDGSVALAFDTLDDPEVVATGAWVWRDFGFATAPELPGVGVPSCVDVDDDGLVDPVIVGR